MKGDEVNVALRIVSLQILKKNIMKNDLDKLPWNPNQFYKAKNYLEAAGMLTALKNGISPYSVLRPIGPTKIID